MRDDTIAWYEHPIAPKPGADIRAFAEIEDGRARTFSFGTGWTAFELVIVRERDAVAGYFNHCAHLPLPLNVTEEVQTKHGRLVCDHHGATHRFSDGRCVAGPCAGKALTAVRLSVIAGRVRVLDDEGAGA